MVTIVIASCCFCKKVRESSSESEGGKGSWVALPLYRAKYQLDERDFQLSHTYCPDCLKMYGHLLISATAECPELTP
ncbi:MAG: hypothetical protein QM771_20410 [Nitrospira sp.]